MIKDGDTRTRLTHEIMTKGNFYIELKDGTEINVAGQCHMLFEIEESYEDGEWHQVDRCEMDDFYLTGYEEGYLFYESDICELFNVDDCGEWDYNGFSYDWCGIEEEDDNEECQKKWNNYKSEFPRITSKEQFRLD